MADKLIDGVKKAQSDAVVFSETINTASIAEKRYANSLADEFRYSTTQQYQKFKLTWNIKIGLWEWIFKGQIETEKPTTKSNDEAVDNVIPLLTIPKSKTKNVKIITAKRFAMAVIFLIVTPPIIIYPLSAMAAYGYAKYFNNGHVTKLLDKAECNIQPAFYSENKLISILSSGYKSEKCPEQRHYIAVLPTPSDAQNFHINYQKPKEGGLNTGWTYFGNDLWGGARIFYTLALKQKLIGASSPTQHISRTVLGTSNLHQQSILERISNKGRDFLNAGGLAATVNPIKLAQLASNSFVCVIGDGTPTAGIVLCAEQIFGAPYSELSSAQKCVLVGTIKWPFVSGSKQRWKLIQKEAIKCIQSAVLDVKTDRKEITKEISMMKMPISRENPLKWGRAFLGNGFGNVVSEMKLRFGQEYLDQSRIDLNIKLNNRNFVNQIQMDLINVQQKNDTIDICLTPNCVGKTDADVLAFISRNGKISNIYTTGSPSLLSGPLTKTSDGNWIYGQPIRANGSIGKLWSALLFGQTSKFQRLCNKAYRGVKNPGKSRHSMVKNCKEPNAWKSLNSSFKHSLNLPIIWGLSKVSRTDLDTLLKSLNLRNLQSDVPLAYQIPFGKVAASPDQISQNLHAIHRGVNGDEPIARRPQLLQESQPLKSTEVNLKSYFKSQSARKRIGSALKAPLDGTLYQLGRALKKQRIGDAIGKSGTSETPAPHTSGIRDKYMVSSFKLGNDYYQIFLMVGTPNPNTPLGFNIRGSAFSPLWKTLINFATKNDRRK